MLMVSTSTLFTSAVTIGEEVRYFAISDSCIHQPKPLKEVTIECGTAPGDVLPLLLFYISLNSLSQVIKKSDQVSKWRHCQLHPIRGGHQATLQDRVRL